MMTEFSEVHTVFSFCRCVAVPVVVSLHTKGEVEDMLRLMAVHVDCLDVPSVINERSNGNVTLDVATFSFTVCFNSR